MATATQKIPSGYKQTEIGVIPADWDVKKIIDFTDCTAGGTPSTLRRKYWGGVIPWMNSGELNDKKILDVEGRITDLGLKESSTKIIPKDSVLVGLAGQGKTRGTVAINRIELCTNQSIAAIFPSPDHDSNYLYFNFDSRYDEIRRLSTGGEGRGGLNLSIIRQIPVAFPKKQEQTAIAAVLSDADDLIAKLKALIEKKKKIRQGAMQELLTGKRRLPGFSGKWETKKLGEVAEFERGRDLPKSEMSDEGVYKCIHYGQLFTEYKELISEVKSKTNSNVGRFYSKKNDVLMPTSDVTPRGLATASCIKEDGVILGGGIMIIRFNTGYDDLFFSYFISQYKSTILKLVKGSTVFHLYSSDLANLEIDFPGPNEQTAIAAIFSDIDAEIEKLEAEVTKYQDIRQGMMQTLLTGKIRLT